MKITQDVRDYAATLNDPQKRAVAGASANGGGATGTQQEAGSAPGATGTQQEAGSAPGATGTQQEAGSAAGATGTQQEIEAGMASMSEKFRQLGSEVYVDADKVRDSNKAL
jgi:phosphomethylpyrimidine synthase